MSVSLPTANSPAGMVIIALPFDSVAEGEALAPAVTATEPVGAGLPLPPLTATVSVKGWAAVMLNDPGVTETVGVVFGWLTVTAEGDVPMAAL